MRRLLLLAVLPAVLSADEHWVKYNSGPFELFTDAGGRSGRETLVRLEEFRFALGQMLGETDLQMPMPVRVFVLKNAKGWTTAGPVTEGRATYNVVLDEKTPPGPPIYAELTRLFLAANTGRMPASFEHGLQEFFSTIQVNGIRITAGAPPQPDLDWARIHLLVVDPEYFGKLRVLLFNLRKGVADDAAYRNAFGKSPAEIEAQAKQHLAAGNFQTASLPNRPLSERDFTERQVSDSDARLARADLLAGSQSAAEYAGLIRDQSHVTEAEEGLGLLALRDHRQDEAGKHFAAAVQAGSQSALLHRVRKNRAGQRKSHASAAARRRHQPQARRAIRLDGRAGHRPRQTPGPLEGRGGPESAQPGLLAGARPGVPRTEGFRRRGQGVDARRAGGHRPGPARAHAPGANGRRAAAPRFHRRATPPGSRRSRKVEGTGPRPGPRSRRQIQGRHGCETGAVVGRSEALRESDGLVDARRVPR